MQNQKLPMKKLKEMLKSHTSDYSKLLPNLLIFSKVFLLHWFDIYIPPRHGNGIAESHVPSSKLSPSHGYVKFNLKTHYAPLSEREISH